MRTKTTNLALAMTAALMASGAVHAQRTGMDENAPPVPPVGPTLPGVTCTAAGTGCPSGLIAPAGIQATIDIQNCNTVIDVEVGVDASHTWSGDILLNLQGPDGTAVQLIEPPPVAGGGCPTPDMYTVLDDDALALVSTYCSFVPPGIQGFLQPANALNAFNGKLGNGTWTLSVDDAYLPFDNGNLNDWSLQVVCDTDADLGISKTGPATVTAGTQMTYSVVATNNGPAAVTQMVVTDTLPAGVAFVSDSLGACGAAGPVVTCNLGAVPGPGDILFDITVAVNANVANGTVLTNTAEISSEVNDPVTANNTDSADTAVAAVAPITVAKSQTTANPIVAGQGAPLCYNVSASNAGPSNVTGLELLDSWTNYPGITWASGGTPCTGGACWTVNIPAGGTVNRQVCLDVASNAAVGTLTNTFAATGSAGGEDLGNPANHSRSVNTAITRVVDIVVNKTGPASVTAGSGAGNLVHTVVVRNQGPSDVTQLAILDALTPPASGGVTNVSGPVGTSLHDIAAGSQASFNITGTVTLAAVEGEAITNTASVTGSGGGESIVNPGNDSDSATTTIAWPTATFNVTKLYNGGTGASVPVSLDCSDGTSLGFGDPASGNSDTTLVWRRFEHPAGTTCSVVEVVPPGYYEAQRTADCDVAAVADGGVYDCTLTNLETVARFNVTKDFSDGSTDDVDVTLTCDTGLPLVQTLTIAGGDPTGVTFVVKDFVDGTMSCAVTEVTNTPGYDLDDSGCEWMNVNSIDGPFACVVNNSAQPGTFTVNKIWELNDVNYHTASLDARIDVECDATLSGATPTGGTYLNGGKTYRYDMVGDGSVKVTVDTLTGSATCSASETTYDSGVETESTCDGPITIGAGQSKSCDITNTLFYEGIPTLSQYGMAIMALLMLGLGMVGFRRFV